MTGVGKGQFKGPYGIAVDSEFRIYVVDKNSSRVNVWKPNFKFDFSFPVGGYPQGVAITQKRTILVTSQSDATVSVYTEKGILISSFGKPHLNNPLGIAVNNQDEVIVVDSGNHRIVIFDSDGKFLRTFGTSSVLHYPWFCCVDRFGNIAVTDQSHRVLVFSSGGKFLGEMGRKGSGPGEFSVPIGIAIDHSGQIIVADNENERLCIFS